MKMAGGSLGWIPACDGFYVITGYNVVCYGYI